MFLLLHSQSRPRSTKGKEKTFNAALIENTLTYLNCIHLVATLTIKKTKFVKLVILYSFSCCFDLQQNEVHDLNLWSLSFCFDYQQNEVCDLLLYSFSSKLGRWRSYLCSLSMVASFWFFANWHLTQLG